MSAHQGGPLAPAALLWAPWASYLGARQAARMDMAHIPDKHRAECLQTGAQPLSHCFTRWTLSKCCMLMQVRKFFIFQVLVCFFGNFIAGSLLNQVQQIIQDPSSIVQVLGNAAPQTAGEPQEKLQRHHSRAMWTSQCHCTAVSPGSSANSAFQAS